MRAHKREGEGGWREFEDIKRLENTVGAIKWLGMWTRIVRHCREHRDTTHLHIGLTLADHRSGMRCKSVSAIAQNAQVCAQLFTEVVVDEELPWETCAAHHHG